MSDRAEDLPEAAVDPSTGDILRWIGLVLWWIFYPIAIGVYYFFYYIFLAVTFVLKLVWEPLSFILLPIGYLLQFMWTCVLAPFRFLAKFETIYIYLGIAALIGITGGLIVSLIYGALQKPLKLDSKPVENGRTAKQYREGKRKRKSKADLQYVSSGYSSPSYFNLSDGSRKANQGNGLVSQTILEEMDSDY